MDKRLRTLWITSGLVLIILVALSFITKPGYIVAEVDTTEVAFTLQSPVENLLQLARHMGQADYLSVSGFSFIPLGPCQVAEAGTDQYLEGIWRVQPEEFGAREGKADLIGLLPDFSLLPAGTHLRLSTQSRRGGGYEVTLTLDALTDKGILLQPQADTVGLGVKRATTEDMQQDELLDGAIAVVLPERAPVQAIPESGYLRFTFGFRNELHWQEQDIVQGSELVFTNQLPDRERSSVVGGHLRIEQSGKELILDRNKGLRLQPDAAFEITDLRLENDHWVVGFEGETDALELSHSHRSYLPSILAWLANQNYLILIVNAYLVLFALYLYTTEN